MGADDCDTETERQEGLDLEEREERRLELIEVCRRRLRERDSWPDRGGNAQCVRKRGIL